MSTRDSKRRTAGTEIRTFWTVLVKYKTALSILALAAIILSFAAIFSALEGGKERLDDGTGVFMPNVTWSFGTSVYFCTITLTTIGYGDISPRTVGGKWALMVFGPLGLTVVAFALMSICETTLAWLARLASRYGESSWCGYLDRNKLYMAMAMYTVFIASGAALFGYVEENEDGDKWGYFNSLYFTFVTMTTIGYGDFSPSTTIGRVCVAFYAFSGLGIIAFMLAEWGELLAKKLQKRAEKSRARALLKILELLENQEKLEDEEALDALERVTEIFKRKANRKCSDKSRESQS